MQHNKTCKLFITIPLYNSIQKSENKHNFKLINMDYRLAQQEYLEYFKLEYKKFIDDLISQIEKEESVVNYITYQSKALTKVKEIKENSFISWLSEDHIVSDETRNFSLNFSDWLDLISYEYRSEYDAILSDSIKEHNKIKGATNK